NIPASVPSQALSCFPLASSQGIPDLCTRAPGACPTMAIRDRVSAVTTGLGAKGRLSLQCSQLLSSLSNCFIIFSRLQQPPLLLVAAGPKNVPDLLPAFPSPFLRIVC